MSRISALLDGLIAEGMLLELSVREAMETVNIAQFTNFELDPWWADHPVPFIATEDGAVKTISAPHMIATMLRQLELREGSDVLVLGAKGGYLTALISHMVGSDGSVVLVDPNAAVMKHVRTHLSDHEGARIVLRKLIAIDRTPPGVPNPLHRVLITGAIRKIPSWILDRLDDGGFAVAPIGPASSQTLMKIERQGSDWLQTPLAPVVFGPVDLTDVSTPPLHSLLLIAEDAIEIGLEMEIISQKEANELLDNLQIMRRDITEATDDEALNDVLDEHSEWFVRLWPVVEVMSQIGSKPRGDDLSFIDGHDDLVP